MRKYYNTEPVEKVQERLKEIEGWERSIATIRQHAYNIGVNNKRIGRNTLQSLVEKEIKDVMKGRIIQKQIDSGFLEVEGK